MMMKKWWCWSLAVSMLAGCSSPCEKPTEELRTTAYGNKYIVTSEGSGKEVVNGATVKVHYTGYLKSNCKEFSTSKGGEPFEFVMGAKEVIIGWEDGIGELRQGDEAILYIESTFGYGGIPRQGVPAHSNLIYEIEVLEVSDPSPDRAPTVDIGNATIRTTQDGLQFFVLEETNGKSPLGGSRVTMEYTGYLSNGEKFDSSYDLGEPLKFQVGLGQVILGWDHCVHKMREGERARFVLPPEYGYGEKGVPGRIPPNETLTFDVHLVAVE